MITVTVNPDNPHIITTEQVVTNVTISSAGTQGPKGETGASGSTQDVSMFATTASLNTFTQSLQQFSSSIQSEVNAIKVWTASLELINTIDTEVTQLYQATASLQVFTASIQSEVNAIKVSTASIQSEVNAIKVSTASLNSKTGSFATTGSNTFKGEQVVSGSILISGSLIPATGQGTFTSSFSLGSPSNAWKDLYISQGSIIFVDALTQETSSFSIEDNAGGQKTVKYTAAITASAYLGDGRQLTNLSANTNWNNTYDSYLIRKTEQLTFSGDYILENGFLLIEGGDEEVEYSANKSFKKEGTLFIGGNLLLKDSVIENNGKISVGGEVILIGNSSIDGTGTII